MAYFVILAIFFQFLGVNASFPLDFPHQLHRRASEAPAACTSWKEIISLCDDAYPGFNDLPSSQQAECLCYDGTTWLPNLFDGWVATCASWAKTADLTDYTVVDSWAGLCTSVGPLTASPAPSSTVPAATKTPIPMTTQKNSASPGTTPPPSTSVNVAANAGCSFAIGGIEYCSSIGATRMTDEILCLCYSSTVFKPTLFDNAVATCADFIKTAIPSDYSIWTSLEGFCSDSGPLTTAAFSSASLHSVQSTTMVGLSASPATSSSSSPTTITSSATQRVVPNTSSTKPPTASSTATGSGGARSIPMFGVLEVTMLGVVLVFVGFTLL